MILEPITDEHVRDVCKVGKGAQCCRYLTTAGAHWSCEKHSALAELIDALIDSRIDMHGRSDNCEGRKSL